MNPGEINWQQLSIGIASLVALVYIVKTMKALMDQVMQFLYNHMSEITRALAGVADKLDNMSDSMDKLSEEVANAGRPTE